MLGVRRLCESTGMAVAVTPGNNGEPAPPPRPRLALRPRRRAAPACASAQTGALPRLTGQARRDRGAVLEPSAQPLVRRAASTAATTRSATADGMISALFRSPTAPPTQPGETTTANGATSPADCLHWRQESPTKSAQPRSRQGRTLMAGHVSQAAKNGHSAWSGASAPSQRPSAAGHASSPHRWRSLIRIRV
jgi:hypothetical protein